MQGRPARGSGGGVRIARRKADMADQAYQTGLEIRDEMLEPEHGTAKVQSADEP